MKIQLPTFIIADLYKDSLVITDDSPVKDISIETGGKVTDLKEVSVERKQEETAKKFYLGENKKKITILIKDDKNVYLSDENLQLLTGILSACQLNLSDVAIVNYDKNAFAYNELKQELQPKFLLMFDVTPQQIQLPFTMPHYQKQPYDSCTFMSAPSLTTMQKNTKEAKVEKSKLWVCLKGIFEI